MVHPDLPPPSGPVIEGAGGVVFNRQGEVLVIRHKNGTWVFPKGRLENGESHLGAALREVEEEAGVRAYCPNPGRCAVTRYVNGRGERRRITYFHLVTEATEPLMRERTFPEGTFLSLEGAAGRLSFAEDRTLLQELR